MEDMSVYVGYYPDGLACCGSLDEVRQYVSDLSRIYRAEGLTQEEARTHAMAAKPPLRGWPTAEVEVEREILKKKVEARAFAFFAGQAASMEPDAERKARFMEIKQEYESRL